MMLNLVIVKTAVPKESLSKILGSCDPPFFKKSFMQGVSLYFATLSLGSLLFCDVETVQYLFNLIKRDLVMEPSSYPMTWNT